MKRFIVILLLLPSLAFGAFTEFYCNASTGSNVNGGSDAGGAATFTCANGNWSTVTNVFTPGCGTNPVSAGVTVGQFASVYVDGATVAVYIARVTAVTNATNGAITLSSSSRAGTAPSTSATGRTIKVGGTWKGPNGTDGFPLVLSGTSFSNATNSSTDQVRINFKNNTSYAISAVVTMTTVHNSVTMQGYSSSPGDGGKAIIDGSTNAIGLVSDSANYDTWADLIFVSSATTGANNNFRINGIGQRLIRLVSHGARNDGIVTLGSDAVLIECEAYDCNKGNNAGACGIGIFSGGPGATLIRCTSHDHATGNGNGFTTDVSSVRFINCIAWNNGGAGFLHDAGASSTAGFQGFLNCDAYNNTGDGIKIFPDSNSSVFWIENCNFIKNGGKGINNTASTSQFTQGFVYNCGYGAGTQANSGGDSTLGAFIETGKVTYASNITPYNAPSTGDFSLVNTSTHAGFNTGRGAFTETDGTNTGTVGFPDIGAANHNDTCTGTGPCQTSGASAY